MVCAAVSRRVAARAHQQVGGLAPAVPTRTSRQVRCFLHCQRAVILGVCFGCCPRLLRHFAGLPVARPFMLAVEKNGWMLNDERQPPTVQQNAPTRRRAGTPDCNSAPDNSPCTPAAPPRGSLPRNGRTGHMMGQRWHDCRSFPRQQRDSYCRAPPSQPRFRHQRPEQRRQAPFAPACIPSCAPACCWRLA